MLLRRVIKTSPEVVTGTRGAGDKLRIGRITGSVVLGKRSSTSLGLSSKCWSVCVSTIACSFSATSVYSLMGNPKGALRVMEVMRG